MSADADTVRRVKFVGTEAECSAAVAALARLEAAEAQRDTLAEALRWWADRGSRRARAALAETGLT